MRFDTRFKLFLFLAATFVTCLLVGDIIGGKLYSFTAFGVELPVSVGMIPFPVVFLLTDILNEFYGKRAARFVTMVGFVMAILTILFIVVAGAVPWADFTRKPDWSGFTSESWGRIFSGSVFILVASVIAYLVAQLVDIFVFHRLKKATSNRHLWLRATGSTVISQLIDTIIINSIYFGSLGMSPVEIAKIAGLAYLIKLTVAIGMTPLLYLGHALVERLLGLQPIQLGPDGEPIPEPVPVVERAA
jgi:hypothetical protein